MQSEEYDSENMTLLSSCMTGCGYVKCRRALTADTSRSTKRLVFSELNILVTLLARL
jgi:hypothetical protein